MQNKELALKWFSEGSKQIALYHDANRIIHAEILDSTRWQLWQFVGTSDKRKILKQGKHRHPKSVCEASLAAILGIQLNNDDDAIQQNAVSRTANPHQPTDFDRARNRLRLWLGLMAVIGAAGLAFYHWVMFQPTNALMFAGVLILLAMLTRQTLRLWHGEISFSQFLGFADVGSAKGKKVTFHAKR